MSSPGRRNYCWVLAPSLLLAQSCSGSKSPDADGPATSSATTANAAVASGVGGSAVTGGTVGGTAGGVAGMTITGATVTTAGGAPADGTAQGGASTGTETTASTSLGGSSSSSTSSGGAGAGGAPACEVPPIDDPGPVPNADVMRSVDPSEVFQTTEGWGTSLCWFANVIGEWSEPRRSEVADLLFDPELGLGLNVVRYNIGGGDAPDHDHMGYGKEMPGFKPTESGGYDFSADAGQRRMLDAALARIPPERLILEAFANSPPWWMTNSGCASGAEGGGSNLKSEYYDDFAGYLSDVVLHFRDTLGVQFRTLEPLNEPNATWWSALGAQEGCHFDRSQQASLLQQVRQSLDTNGLSAVELSAADESSFDESVDTYNAYDAATRELVRQINTHAYSGTERAELRSLATRDGKRLWSSEVDGSGAPEPFDVFPHDHGDIAPGLDLAQRITRDLREMQVDAWVFWQAVESEQAQQSLNKNWGLLHADFEDGSEELWLTKKYYVMLQYTRAIRPGFVMIDVDDDNAVAFMNRADGTIVIVQRNESATGAVYSYDLSGFASLPPRAAAYRTSSGEDFAELDDLPVVDGRLVAPIAARSVTTFVLNCATLPP